MDVRFFGVHELTSKRSKKKNTAACGLLDKLIMQISLVEFPEKTVL